MAVSVDIKPLAELLDGGFSKSSIRKAFFRFSYERIILMYYRREHFETNEHSASRFLSNSCETIRVR